MATLRYFSGYNGFIPSATGQVIAYVRDPKKFRINNYVQYVPSPEVKGAFYVLGRDMPARIPSDNGTASPEFLAWHDGDDRPDGEWNKPVFKLDDFTTIRRDVPSRIGWQTAAMAKAGGLKLIEFTSAALAQQMMTTRTQVAISALETTSNWPSSHVQAANTLNGGRGMWSGASDDPNHPQYNAIKRTLMNALKQIQLDTNGQVSQEDLVVVIAPDLAIEIAQSPEVLNYVRESPVAMQQVLGVSENINQRYGIPERLFGWKFVVEDAVVVAQFDNSSATEATTNRKFIKTYTSALILSRPGGLDGEYGAPSYSTVQIYHYDGLLKVSAFDEPKHERTDLHVEENIAVKISAGYAGFMVTNCM
jgi:hypothetical protein